MADLLSEIKATIAFQCFAAMSTSPGTTQDQHNMIYDLYHGTDTTISYVDRFLRASEYFAPLFRHMSCGSDHKLVLLEELHRQESLVWASLEDAVGTDGAVKKGSNNHLTRSVLTTKSRANQESAKGEALLRTAKNVVKRCKEFLPHAERFLVNGDMPSGKKYPEDYAEFIPPPKTQLAQQTFSHGGSLLLWLGVLCL